jgi:hypothetical protein
MNGERFEDWFKKDLVKPVPRKSSMILDRAAFPKEEAQGLGEEARGAHPVFAGIFA